MVTTTSWREVLLSSAASFWVRSDLVSGDRILASSTTRPVNAGNFGAAQTFPPKKAGVSRTRNASKAAASRIRYGFGVVPGCAAAGAGGGAALLAPGKLTTGADCAAVLAANGVACL